LPDYEAMLARARAADLTEEEGAALGRLARYWLDRDEPDHFARAIDLYQQRLRTAQQTGNFRAQGEALTGLGRAATRLFEPKAAVDFFAHATAAFAEVGDERSRADALSEWGRALAALGEDDQAFACRSQAVEAFERLGDRYGLARALVQLAASQRARRQLDDARKTLQRALALSEQFNAPPLDCAAAYDEFSLLERDADGIHAGVPRADAAEKIYRTIQEAEPPAAARPGASHKEAAENYRTIQDDRADWKVADERGERIKQRLKFWEWQDWYRTKEFWTLVVLVTMCNFIWNCACAPQATEFFMTGQATGQPDSAPRIDSADPMYIKYPLLFLRFLHWLASVLLLALLLTALKSGPVGLVFSVYIWRRFTEAYIRAGLQPGVTGQGRRQPARFLAVFPFMAAAFLWARITGCRRRGTGEGRANARAAA
jgi:tetratricopeptide (TPR) repeat protein